MRATDHVDFGWDKNTDQGITSKQKKKKGLVDEEL